MINAEILTYEKPKVRSLKVGTKKGFKNYLEANKETQYQAMNSTKCPLASYFSEVNGFKVSVGSSHCSGMGASDSWKPLSKWHTAFVKALDMGSAFNDEGLFIVTGEQALEVLDSL